MDKTYGNHLFVSKSVQIQRNLQSEGCLETLRGFSGWNWASTLVFPTQQFCRIPQVISGRQMRSPVKGTWYQRVCLKPLPQPQAQLDSLHLKTHSHLPHLLPVYVLGNGIGFMFRNVSSWALMPKAPHLKVCHDFATPKNQSEIGQAQVNSVS